MGACWRERGDWIRTAEFRNCEIGRPNSGPQVWRERRVGYPHPMSAPTSRPPPLCCWSWRLICFVRCFVHEVLSLLAWVVAVIMLKLVHEHYGGDDRFVGSSGGAAVLAFALLSCRPLSGSCCATLGRRSANCAVRSPIRGGLHAQGLIGATLSSVWPYHRHDLGAVPNARGCGIAHHPR